MPDSWDWDNLLTEATAVRSKAYSPYSNFAPSFPVRCYTPEGSRLDTDVASLLPHGFSAENLEEK